MRQSTPENFQSMAMSGSPDSATGSAPRSRLFLWVLFGTFCTVWFLTLGARTLVPTDEGRYAEIAREMAATGDFITPRLNGIKYYGKPPLQAWMTALAFKVFGVGEWQARLWTGICGVSGILMLLHAGKRVYGERVGVTAALVLGSTWYWGIAGHTNSYDMSLSAMMTMALAAFLLAQHDQATAGERRNWMLVCWAGLALAFLSKGLVAVALPGTVLILYSLTVNDWRIWRRMHFPPGVLLFLVIAAPWFVVMSMRNPAFPHFFFIREHFHRFASNVHLRDEHWYFFIPLLAIGMTPWLGVLLQGLRNGWHGKHGTSCFRPGWLLALWAIFIFVFFSTSRAKLPSYILPIFPALALLIAATLEHASHRTVIAAAALYGAIGGVALAALAAMQIRGGLPPNLALLRDSMGWVAGAAVLALGGGALSVMLARRRKEQAIVVLAIAGFLGGQALLLSHEPYGRFKAGVAHLPAISAALAEDTPIYAVGTYEYALPFYLGRTMTMVAHAEDGMRQGLQEEPQLWIPELNAFIFIWKERQAQGKKALAIMNADMFAELEQRGMPMRIVAQDRLRVIVSNRVKQ